MPRLCAPVKHAYGLFPWRVERAQLAYIADRIFRSSLLFRDDWLSWRRINERSIFQESAAFE